MFKNYPIKISWKTEWLPALIIVLSAALGAYFYNNFPETVVTHWNFAGQADGWGSGKTNAIAMPLVLLAMYLLFLFLPYLDPKKERYEEFGRAYGIIKNSILGLMAFIFAAAGFSNLGYPVRIDLLTPFAVGAVFVVVGNYMGKVKANWFIGIRTPWTLSSEEVWNKTHRLGGRVFVIAGFLFVATALVPVYMKLPLFILTVILMLSPIVYSFILFRKNTKK